MRVAVTVFVSHVPPGQAVLHDRARRGDVGRPVDHHGRADEVGQVRVALQLGVERRRTAGQRHHDNRGDRRGVPPYPASHPALPQGASVPPWLLAMPPGRKRPSAAHPATASDPIQVRAQKTTPICGGLSRAGSGNEDALPHEDGLVAVAAGGRAARVAGPVGAGVLHLDLAQRPDRALALRHGPGDERVVCRGDVAFAAARGVQRWRCTGRETGTAAPAWCRARASPRSWRCR